MGSPTGEDGPAHGDTNPVHQRGLSPASIIEEYSTHVGEIGSYHQDKGKARANEPGHQRRPGNTSRPVTVEEASVEELLEQLRLKGYGITDPRSAHEPERRRPDNRINIGEDYPIGHPHVTRRPPRMKTVRDEEREITHTTEPRHVKVEMFDDDDDAPLTVRTRAQIPSATSPWLAGAEYRAASYNTQGIGRCNEQRSPADPFSQEYNEHATRRIPTYTMHEARNTQYVSQAPIRRESRISPFTVRHRNDRDGYNERGEAIDRFAGVGFRPSEVPQSSERIEDDQNSMTAQRLAQGMKLVTEKWSGKGKDCNPNAIARLENDVKLHCAIGSWDCPWDSNRAALRLVTLLKEDAARYYQDHILPRALEERSFTLPMAMQMIRQRFIDRESFRRAEERFYALYQSSDLNEKNRLSVHQLATKLQEYASMMTEMTDAELKKQFFKALDVDYQSRIRDVLGGEPIGMSFSDLVPCALDAEEHVNANRRARIRAETERQRRNTRSDRSENWRRQQEPERQTSAQKWPQKGAKERRDKSVPIVAALEQELNGGPQRARDERVTTGRADTKASEKDIERAERKTPPKKMKDPKGMGDKRPNPKRRNPINISAIAYQRSEDNAQSDEESEQEDTKYDDSPQEDPGAHRYDEEEGEPEDEDLDNTYFVYHQYQRSAATIWCEGATIRSSPIDISGMVDGDRRSYYQPEVMVAVAQKEKIAPDNATIRVQPNSSTRQPRVHDCMTVNVIIGGTKACMMIDSGAGIDLLAEKFITAHNLPYTNYTVPVKLGLATTGSSGKLNRWTRLTIQVQGKVEKRAFDIANIAQWDGLLGAPFLYDYAVFIGLNPPTIMFGKPPKGLMAVEAQTGTEMTPEAAKQEREVRQITKRQEMTDDWLDELATEEDIDQAREEILAIAKRYSKEKPPVGGAERPRWMQHEIKPVRPRVEKLQCYPIPEKAMKSFVKKLKLWQDQGVIIRPKEQVYHADPCFVKIKPGRFDADGDPEIRLLFDLRARNASVDKVLSPLPNTDHIVRQLARAPFCTCIDLSNAYEQIRLTPESIPHTTFITPLGMFQTTIMQQGDNNAPATMQNIIWRTFEKEQGESLLSYLDDLWSTAQGEPTRRLLRKHIDDVRNVYEKLDEAKLYSNWQKTVILPEQKVVLGRIIGRDGSVAMADDKRKAIAEWPIPKDSKAVSRFLGTVNWLAPNMPNAAQYTSVLSELNVTSRLPFQWNDTHTTAFEKLKMIVDANIKVYPIEYTKLEEGWKIFVFTDASNWGIGGWIGIGTDWEKAHDRPAVFHSRKFTTAQAGYTTHAAELLAVYDVIKSNEEILYGYPFTICTDNQYVRQIQTIPHLTHREWRIVEYLSKFEVKIIHIPGPKNWASDALSRIWENHKGETSTDVWLTSEIDLLDDEVPHQQAIVIAALRVGTDLDTDETMFKGGAKNEFLDAVRRALVEDITFQKIVQRPEQYFGYVMDDGILWYMPPQRPGEAVMCLPKGTVWDRALREVAMTRAHKVLGHLGAEKTLEYVRHNFWWPMVSKDVLDFCKTCESCNRAKALPAKTSGFLKPIIPPAKKWHTISMDWIQLKETMYRGRLVDELWVLRDMFVGIIRGIPTHTSRTARDAANDYIEEIYKIHGLPAVIVSDRDPVLTSKLWR